MRVWTFTAATLISLGLAQGETPPLGSYQMALAAEKVSGERDRAVALYREVVKRYRSGSGEYSLAARAQQRLRRLGEETIDLTIRKRQLVPFQGIRKQFEQSVQIGRDVTVFSDNPFSLGRSDDIEGNSFSNGREISLLKRSIKSIERQTRALRFAFGITGLLEYMEAAAAARSRPRPLSAHELYLVGLYAEQESNNPEEARSSYQLAQKDSDALLTDRIQRRLNRLDRWAGTPTTTP